MLSNHTSSIFYPWNSQAVQRMIARLSFPLACMLGFVVCTVSVPTQEVAAQDVAGLGVQQDVEELFLPQPPPALRPINDSAVDEQIESLSEATKRMRTQLQQQTTNRRESFMESVTKPEPTMALPYSKDDLDASVKIDEIRSRIQLIKRLRNQTREIREREEEFSNDSIPPLVASQLAEAAMSADSMKGEPPPPTLVEIENNLDSVPKQDMHEAAFAAQSSMNAQQVLSKPVDTMRLAESLYRTRNFPAALKALQSIEGGDLSFNDRSWRDLLIAMCQKRLGNIADSQEELRRLANEQTSGFSKDMARWWLSQSKATDEKKAIVHKLSDQVDTLVERSRAHVQ